MSLFPRRIKRFVLSAAAVAFVAMPATSVLADDTPVDSTDVESPEIAVPETPAPAVNSEPAPVVVEEEAPAPEVAEDMAVEVAEPVADEASEPEAEPAPSEPADAALEPEVVEQTAQSPPAQEESEPAAAPVVPAPAPVLMTTQSNEPAVTVSTNVPECGAATATVVPGDDPDGLVLAVRHYVWTSGDMPIDPVLGASVDLSAYPAGTTVHIVGSLALSNGAEILSDVVDVTVPASCDPEDFKPYVEYVCWQFPADWPSNQQPKPGDDFWPQTRLSDPDSLDCAPPCGAWAQGDKYLIEDEADRAIFESLGNKLTDGEDRAIYKSHKFFYGGDCTPPTKVVPADVVFHDATCAEPTNTFTVLTSVGSEYVKDGEVIAAGTHAASGTVTIEARATDGYVHAKSYNWVHEFKGVPSESECNPPVVEKCPADSDFPNVPVGDLTDVSGDGKVNSEDCDKPVPPVEECPEGEERITDDGDGVLDPETECAPPVVPPTDVCPNAPEGVQTSVPEGMVKDDAGNCVTPTPETPNFTPVAPNTADAGLPATGLPFGLIVVVVGCALALGGSGTLVLARRRSR